MTAIEPTPRNTKSRTHILDTAQRIVGTKGLLPLGLNEILAAAGVPKGSFYYYFASKEAFGTALLEHYFANYLSEIEEFLSAPGRSARERLAAYWTFWRGNQERQDPEGKCLAVKLGTEVSDMSEEMRLALKSGTSAIISRLARVIKEGKSDGSISIIGSPTATAHTLYELWMGASVMSKISRDRGAFNTAIAATDRILSGEAF
jgi:TetR/AcrR family transcriptional regulator, transcriptional repressor for nem operon